MTGTPPSGPAAPAGSGHVAFAAAEGATAWLRLPTRDAAAEAAPAAPLLAGIDLLDVPRLGRAATRSGPVLERRICTRTELSGLPEHPRQRLTELSRIFSIKESAVKVLGGMPGGASFRDLCTAGSHPHGATLALRGEAARRADLLGVSLLTGSQELDACLLLSWAIAMAS
jgi:phosphopantetheinyl transferase (holo-ACP synthase)